MRYFIALTLVTILTALPMTAQTPDANEQQKLADLIKEVQAQQGQLADNQNKIDAKLADLAESIRQARLFAAKAGK